MVPLNLLRFYFVPGRFRGEIQIDLLLGPLLGRGWFGAAAAAAAAAAVFAGFGSLRAAAASARAGLIPNIGLYTPLEKLAFKSI